MKLLTVMRHAKSSRDDPSLEDFDRPLSELGRRQASAMGAYMKKRAIAPDLILCSPSKRTRETLAGLVRQLDEARSIDFSPRLYNAPPGAILAEVAAAPETGAHALVIGHNPGIKLLAAALADPSRSHAADADRIEDGFKSGALAHFELAIERWADADEGSGALLFYATPKDVMG